MLYSILILIVDTIAVVLGGLLLLRFWMQAVRVRPPHAIGQFIYQLTDWLVKPLRRVLPGMGGYDWASMAGAFLICLLSVAIELGLRYAFAVDALVVLSLLRVVRWALYGLMGLIIIEVIFSWVNPHAPLAPFVGALTDPLMRPLRRIIPLVGSIDLSPLVAFLLLRIALFLADSLLLSLI